MTQTKRDAFTGTREAMATQVAVKKKQLMDCKPIGQRLDNKRSALGRSQKRLAQAKESLQLAQIAVEAATLEENQLTQELAELEASVASAPSATEVPGLESLEQQLIAAVNQLKQMESLQPSVLTGGGGARQCGLLLGRFQSTLEAAAKFAEATSSQAKRRLTSKQTPTPPLPSIPPHRLDGKQPMPSFKMPAHFGPVRSKLNSATGSCTPYDQTTFLVTAAEAPF